jgi:hypothetical protein
MAFEDADLVAQHQQLSLIGGAVAEGCEGEVDEEPEAGVKDVEEHGWRLIVAGLGRSPLSSDGLSAPHTRHGHTGLDQRTPSGQPAVTPLALGRIVRQDRLGGLIHEYDGAAA